MPLPQRVGVPCDNSKHIATESKSIMISASYASPKTGETPLPEKDDNSQPGLVPESTPKTSLNPSEGQLWDILTQE